MRALLARLEPFALDLWLDELGEWLPARSGMQGSKRLFYGGLYQMVEFER